MKQFPGVVVALLVFAIGVAAVSVPGQGSWPAVVVVVCATILPALSAVAARRRGLVVGGREGTSWRLLAIAMTLMSTIYAIDYLGAMTLEIWVVIATYAIGIAALITVPLPTSGPYERLVATLDAIGVAALVATLTFWLTANSGIAAKIYYTIADAGVIAMMGYIMLRRSQRHLDWQIFWLAVGVTGTLAGTLLNTTSFIPYAIGHPADYAYLTGLLGFSLAPAVRRPPESDLQPVLKPVRWLHVLIPYSGAGVLAIVILVREIRTWEQDQTGAFIGIGAVTVMVLVLFRQLAMIAEQRRRVGKEQQGVIATVSHELRTPLTSVVGFLDLLEDWGAYSDEEKMEMVALMRGQSHVLARVVGDLVALARSEIDRVEVNKEHLSIGEIVEAARAMVPELATAEVTYEIAPETRLVADPERMVQLIANFLSNAAVYGGGQICLTAFNRGASTVIEVHDNGPGVPDVYQFVIWERFERASHRQSSIPGSGIGLAVARGIARAHGGDTYYRSSHRRGGACFGVRVPLEQPTAATVLQMNGTMPLDRRALG